MKLSVALAHFVFPFCLVAWIEVKPTAPSPPAVTAEFCEAESFNATCDASEVILMTHARYGRMKKGRCVKLDYGHLGCAADVLELMDTRCSGRQHCEIRVPDMMLTSTKPCPDDLKPYLEASYQCVRVPTIGESVCEGRTSIHLRQQNGFLSSSVLSGHPHCDGTRIPWKIKVKPGQYIRVTLYDFYVAKRKATSDPYSYPRCQIYAWIKEKLESGTRNVTVCGGVPRRKNVYTSATNRVELVIAPNGDHDAPRFLLQYEALGCPDLVPVANSWLTRLGDNVKIRCNFTRDIYDLKCVDHRWVGYAGNCSAALLASGNNMYAPEPVVPYGVSIVIVLGIALIIGLMVLAVGLIILRRQSPCRFGRRPPAVPTRRDKENVHNAWQEHRDSQLSYGRANWLTADRTMYAGGPELPPCTPLMETLRKQSLYGQLQQTTLPCGCSTYVTSAELGNYTSGMSTLPRSAPAPPKVSQKPPQPPHYFVLDPATKRIMDTGNKLASQPDQQDARRNSFGFVAMETDDVKLRQRTSDGTTSCAEDDDLKSPEKRIKYIQHCEAPDVSYTAICKDSIENNMP